MQRGASFALALMAGAALCAAPAFASSPLPAPAGYVNDFAGVLNTDTKAKLEADLTAFEKSTSNEVVVATIPSMDGDYIEHYAPELFKQWGIGKKEKDNGVLLLLSVQDRKLRIEVGYGLEGALPDSLAQRIIDEQMTPLLKSGDYDGAVEAGVAGIEAATQGEYQGTPSSSAPVSADFISWIFFGVVLLVQFLGAGLARSKSWYAGGILGVFIGIGLWYFLALSVIGGGLLTFLLLLFGLGFDYVVSTAYQKAKISGGRPPWWIGGGGFGGGGGGGFGGFGGGSSGGGGASGSW